ncbi:GNAT family N-acetyltransferase [Pseudoxanthomonas sp. UTMC 1351]|uniref:GNAT family N-acetyltransferase n=1 Tax=Pseudoxanthomonas sp. UTMC 1351 TaxID=2695853 RepID=UPI0034CFEE77
MWIRTETQADHAAIDGLLGAAFAQTPGGGQVERRIVDALRKEDALTLSLVADIDGRIAGHVAFSPVVIGDTVHGWYELGPLAVAPGDQKRGIGSALILAGIAELERLRAQGCVVLGEPDYYSRFGFRHVPELVYPDAPAEYFMGLPFGDRPARGVVAYHPAFLVS